MFPDGPYGYVEIAHLSLCHSIVDCIVDGAKAIGGDGAYVVVPSQSVAEAPSAFLTDY